MPDTKKPYVIVVGIDYSETGELALDRAFGLAAPNPNAEVHVLHVMTLDLPALAPELDGASSVRGSLTEGARRLETYLEPRVLAFQNARSGGGLAALRVVPHLREGSPAFEVAQLAADLEADIVVVGTHGRRAISRLVLGSVAELTVRLAPCAVLVVRPKARPASIPAIEPPCPRCLEARAASGGKELWCAQHRERHGQRHTYHQGDRAGAETNMPLVVRS